MGAIDHELNKLIRAKKLYRQNFVKAVMEAFNRCRKCPPMSIDVCGECVMDGSVSSRIFRRVVRSWLEERKLFRELILD